MKSYQRVLKTITRFGLVIGLAAGLYFGVGFLFDVTAAETALATWCLDNGGRIVRVDRVTGCFELTVVDVDDGMFDSPQSECLTDPLHIWHRFSINTSRRCYSFVRLAQEN